VEEQVELVGNLHRVLVDKCIGHRKQDIYLCRRRRLTPYRDEKMSGLLKG
jgi:hypothetical protein